jgi:dienelactone hydrolase
MTRRIRIAHLVIAAFIVLVAPPLLRQLFPGEPRQYEATSLDQVRFSDVSFHNSTQDIALGGMLFIPAGDGPFPAAVIIHGSGTSSRANRWYLSLARYLQDNGVVVLLPDKRGSEQSSGDWRTADFEDLATDTHAAVDFMSNQQFVPVSRTGLIGMSQGGWIAPIVARDRDDLAFIVNMVGSAVTPNEQLLYEEDHNIRQMGFLPGVSYALALASSSYLRNVRMRDFYAAVGDYDPLPLWDAVSVPVLMLYGREDTNVPADVSVARLQELGKASITIVVYEESGHALQDPEGRGNDLIRYEALEAIRRHILGID